MRLTVRAEDIRGCGEEQRDESVSLMLEVNPMALERQLLAVRRTSSHSGATAAVVILVHTFEPTSGMPEHVTTARIRKGIARTPTP